jgi:F-type H+-transporting ATPase subunit b
MPQLSQAGEIYASQLFWLAIVFALVYFGIGRMMVPRIERTIENRDVLIKGDIAAAEAARDAARRIQEAYDAGLEGARNDAGHLTGTAKAEASAAAEAQVKAATAGDEVRIAEATAEIEARTRQAEAEIDAATVEAVEAIVAKLSGLAVDRATIEQTVKAVAAHG